MADENEIMETDAIALDDVEEDTSTEDMDVSNIVDYVMARFKKSEDYRYEDELRWVRSYRNYRGIYGPDVQFTEAEKSRVFIKVTKTKTLAAYGQIIDVLFANNKFPLTVEPTTLPEGVVSDVSFDPKEPESIRNRLDETIQFNYLDKSVILSIVDKFLTKLQAQLDKRNVEIQVSKKVIEWIADNGYDKEMGARPMERFISQNIKKPLVDKLLFGNLKSGGLIKLDIEKGKLKFTDAKTKVKA